MIPEEVREQHWNCSDCIKHGGDWDCDRVHCHKGKSAQQEQRWIQCTERLPEVGQSVLMSVGGMYTAEGCLREDGNWAQFRWNGVQRKDMVGAWMPLPQPWREGQDDQML